MIGERTNVTGSRTLRRADQDRATHDRRSRSPLDQVRGGANILDVNMDEGMLDSEQAMTTFLNLVATEPEIARVARSWSTAPSGRCIEAGLKCVQGKGIVNSISLKEGEADFLEQGAARAAATAPAVVVMAFDEAGQADTVERKVAICQRAYTLLTEKAGFDPHDIIFDPNILAVATGIEEHNDYAMNFIEAARIIKEKLPRRARSAAASATCRSRSAATTSCARRCTAAFLYHAIKAGMDMGIVNAGQLAVYEEIPKELLERVEDVLFNRRPDATERLVEFAETVKGSKAKKREAELAWRQRAPSSSASRTRWSRASSTSSRPTSRRRAQKYDKPARRHRRAR